MWLMATDLGARRARSLAFLAQPFQAKSGDQPDFFRRNLRFRR
jgi:hypothetical protein